MAIELVFETHSTSEDNEEGRATGWLPGRLSERGRAQAQAQEPGLRRRTDGIAAVFSSDLGRCVEAVSIAFAGSAVQVLHDWRLRECDCGQRVLIVGHVATRWGLDHLIGGVPLEGLAVADFAWQEGWEYRCEPRAGSGPAG